MQQQQRYGDGCEVSGVYDVAVIGSGIIGSAAAYTQAKEGKRVLLLEQFPLPHSRGSSHGATRCIRTAYREAFIARLMADALQGWKDLQQESATTLLRQTGMLGFSATKPESVKSYNENMVGFKGQPVLTRTELARDYPLINFTDEDTGTYEAGAGVLYADKCLQAYQNMFVKRGGVIRDGEKVISIVPGEVVGIKGTKSTYKAKQLVVACGAWAQDLLKSIDHQLPLSAVAIQVCYWRSKDNVDHSKIPVFYSNEVHVEAYGLPVDEYPGLMKICLHYGVPCAPDQRDMVDQQKEAEHLSELKEFVATRFPYLVPEPAIKERCMYTMTPDGNPIIECHPVYKNIAYACGFSGHGFKLAPVIGVILSDLLSNRKVTYAEAVKEFSSDRFIKSNKFPNAKL